MWNHLRTSLVVLSVMTLLTGVVYPLAVTLLAQTLFPGPANGSIVVRNGQPAGSEQVDQPFSKPEYFWGRLSATSPVPYDAAASSGSNFGPRHPDLARNARERIDDLRRFDPTVGAVPVDLVTASGSGLDPHVSPAAAEVQVRRVAAARKLTDARVRALVRAHTEPRQFGLLGEPRVNVLTLNLALDALPREARMP
jgi:K+-transporting ATPase ATPase C chain